MKHYVYKCRVQKYGKHEKKYGKDFILPWTFLITVYSCRDFYVKREDEQRSRRVTRDYLCTMFPNWYRDSGLFHVEQRKAIR